MVDSAAGAESATARPGASEKASEMTRVEVFRGMEGTITGPPPLTMVRVKDTIRLRLEKMVDRYEEIGRSLADPAVIGRQREFRDLSVEYARLTPVAEKFGAFQALERELASAREMQNDSDPGHARDGPARKSRGSRPRSSAPKTRSRRC